MEQATALILAALAVLLVVLLYCYWARPAAGVAAGKEHYGPPPGAARAISHHELDYRGWPEADASYHGTTAGAVAHMIERSA